MCVWAQGAGIFFVLCVGAVVWHFPAVCKVNGFRKNIFVSGGEIIPYSPVVVSAQTAECSLEHNKTSQGVEEKQKQNKNPTILQQT